MLLTINDLKTRFQTLDRPTQQDYMDLIDTLIATNAGLPATPDGPAGGDLDGTYPDPIIRANAVTDGKVATHALGVNKLNPGAAAVGKVPVIGAASVVDWDWAPRNPGEARPADVYLAAYPMGAFAYRDAGTDTDYVYWLSHESTTPCSRWAKLNTRTGIVTTLAFRNTSNDFPGAVSVMRSGVTPINYAYYTTDSGIYRIHLSGGSVDTVDTLVSGSISPFGAGGYSYAQVIAVRNNTLGGDVDIHPNMVLACDGYLDSQSLYQTYKFFVFTYGSGGYTITSVPINWSTLLAASLAPASPPLATAPTAAQTASASDINNIWNLVNTHVIWCHYNPFKKRLYLLTAECGLVHILNLRYLDTDYPDGMDAIFAWMASPAGSAIMREKSISISGAGNVNSNSANEKFCLEYALTTDDKHTAGDEISVVFNRIGLATLPGSVTRSYWKES